MPFAMGPLQAKAFPELWPVLAGAFKVCRRWNAPDTDTRRSRLKA